MTMKYSCAKPAAAILLLFLSCAARTSAQSDYTVVKVANGGTITGTVKWSGPVPKPPKLPITKDSRVCDPESHKIRDLERLLVDSDGGVANTVVFLKDITKGKAMDLPDTRQHLDQKNCRYIPHIMIVPLGTSLEAKSSDPVLHTVHMTGAASNNIPFPMQNQAIAISLARNGVVELKCNAGHVWMNAEILVVKHPYYSVTDEHGFFKLADVPPGEYEIEAWHEGWQNLSEETVLDVAAQVKVKRPIYSVPETWAKKVHVKPGETSEINFLIGPK
ncbi:MAG: carboxypeptidase regulatory-like domain-containing protein [Candidatus Acidiferrales bacterium]